MLYLQLFVNFFNVPLLCSYKIIISSDLLRYMSLLLYFRLKLFPFKLIFIHILNIPCLK